MPALEISMPKVDSDTKETLTKNLTDAFASSTKFGAEIFGIRYHEYEIGQSASGGKVWDGTGVPYLHMLLYCPRVDRKTKQAIVESFTKVFTQSIGHDGWKPVIHICEHPYDNVGVQGQLLSDQFEACAKAEFYYDVEDEKE